MSVPKKWSKLLNGLSGYIAGITNKEIIDKKDLLSMVNVQHHKTIFGESFETITKDFTDEQFFRLITSSNQKISENKNKREREKQAADKFEQMVAENEIIHEDDIELLELCEYDKNYYVIKIIFESELTFIEGSLEEIIEQIEEIIEEYEADIERYFRIADAHHKNNQLINDLKQKRITFAGIGTNKVKRRLNKLALTDPVAKAVRLALETEDKSISAKDSYGKYKDKIYRSKTKLILDLCQLFKEQNWVYGIQKSNVPTTSHVIYFEIPGCDQISWHFTPEEKEGFPEYTKAWDGKINSTIKKLEMVAVRLFQEK